MLCAVILLVQPPLWVDVECSVTAYGSVVPINVNVAFTSSEKRRSVEVILERFRVHDSLGQCLCCH